MSVRMPGPTQVERQELAEMLPTPPDRDLAPSRHRELRNYLRREFTMRATASKEATYPLPLRRRLATLPLSLLAGATATIVVLTLLVGLGLGTGLGDPPEHRPALSAEAPRLLHRIASAAAERTQRPVRDDQFAYLASKIAYSTQSADDPRVRLQRPHRREIWLSVDGSRTGLLREQGSPQEKLPYDGIQPYINSPTYRYLESLPTDPAALLRRIYKETKGAGPNPDQEAFVTIGDALREQIAPPKVSAALYRAAAHIPGVFLVADSVDAIGRHGVAVARVHEGERTEWIFDRRTLEMIGERSVLVEDSPRGTAGTITSTTAVLAKGFTDETGELPKEKTTPQPLTTTTS